MPPDDEDNYDDDAVDENDEDFAALWDSFICHQMMIMAAIWKFHLL